MAFNKVNLIFLEVFYIKQELPINEQIRLKQVQLIDDEGQKLGIMDTAKALDIAYEKNLDLVLVAPNGNPPVCKVMDYNKYRYEKQKKEKEATKKQRASSSQLKEFRLSPVIDIGDFETKLRNVRKYLEKGDKIKLSIRFKGRQMAHTELGKDVLDKFAMKLEDLATIEQQAKLDGRTMIMLLAPKKEK